MMIQNLIIMRNFVLHNTIDKNYEKEDQPLMSLETDSDSCTTSESSRSTTSGRTMKRCSSTTSRSTRKTTSTCSTYDSSDTDSGTDEENEEKRREYI